MSITVDTPAIATDLALVDSIKVELNITDATQDAFLATLVSQASDIVRAYCGRVFERETVTEKLEGSGNTELLLTRTPIVSVTSITVNAVAVLTTEFTIEDPDAGVLIKHTIDDPPAPVIWETPPFLIRGISRRPSIFGSKNIVIVYVSGYLLPGESNRTLPKDLERATESIVKDLFFNRAVDPRVTFQKTADASEGRAARDIGSLTPQVSQLLATYRRISI